MSLASAKNAAFLSTPSARRATLPSAISCSKTFISIHALREEGDYPRDKSKTKPEDFYPRPPRGGRLRRTRAISARYEFLSTPSARRATAHATVRIDGLLRFLSTPSARRATTKAVFVKSTKLNFYPRPPRGGRPYALPSLYSTALFLSTPSARRATPKTGKWELVLDDFYPRPPRGGRRAAQRRRMERMAFLSTPSARRAT